MLGAIFGDIIGKPFESVVAPGRKSKDFTLFEAGRNRFTDDSVMTIAIFDGLYQSGFDTDEETVKAHLVESCQYWGRKYPGAGYGGAFRHWLVSNNPKPYHSFGNGSAMRVSSIGWLYDTLEETRKVARWSAEITHNHPEGIKGAESTASAIWMARNGKSKQEIKEYIENEFGYDLNRTCDEIRPDYEFDVTCQGSVPEAIIAFLEGNDYEDVVRLAVSLGGDADTQGCIAGSIAEAYFGIPDEIIKTGIRFITKEMLDVINNFTNSIKNKEKK